MTRMIASKQVELTWRERTLRELRQIWEVETELSASCIYHTVNLIDRTVQELLEEITIARRQKPNWRECADIETWLERDCTTQGYNHALSDLDQVKKQILMKYRSR
jgi:hypothetical protein